MTPKEKAIELVDKMYGDESDYMTDSQAKQCALIAVDEILNINPFSFYDKKFHLIKIKDYKNYWQEVKQEIEKL